MDQGDEDYERFEPTKPVVALVVVSAAIIGLSQGTPALAGCPAAAALALAVGHRSWRIAATLTGLATVASWSPICYPYAIATVFGALGGWLIKKAQDRQDGIARLASELNEKNSLVLESQIELLKSDEVSRCLLAADLHDQALNDQKALAEALRSKRSTMEPRQYEQAMSKLQAVMTETRQIMDRLYPAQLEVIGLCDSLDSLLRKMCQASGCKARFRDKSPKGVVDRLNELERIVVYRIVEEAIVNACRHSGAQIVSLDIECDDVDIAWRVHDDGKGMARSLFTDPGRGIRFIQTRAELIGAIVGWTGREDGKGTTFELKLPILVAG